MEQYTLFCRPCKRKTREPTALLRSKGAVYPFPIIWLYYLERNITVTYIWNHRIMMRIRNHPYRSAIVAGALFVLLGTSLAITGKSSPASAKEKSPTIQNEDGQFIRRVTVMGKGEVSGSPDTAHVNIGVETEDKQAEEAMEENNIRATEIISSLKEIGVEDKDIQTSNFSIHSIHDDKGRKVTGYRVNNIVSVTIRDLEKAGELLDEVVKVGANNIHGMSFSVEDPSELLEEARAKAMENAKEKASQLAEGGDTEVGKVLSITEGGGSQVVFDRVDYGLGMGSARMESAEPRAPVQPGEQTFTAQVQVTFELE